MGGYEWTVDVLAREGASETVGIFVREENKSAPDGWGVFGNGGISGINAPCLQLIK